MVRIQTGEFRGRRLQVEGSARPTEGRVREALFSIWQDRLDDATLLDLFAGSGCVGIEALSRGVRKVVFVEKAPRSAAAVRRNCRTVGVEGRVQIVRGTLPGVLARKIIEKFDLVFADPPYAYEDYEELLLHAAKRLRADGELVIEHSSRRDLPEVAPLTLVDRRAYGESTLSFFRPGGSQDSPTEI